MILDLLRARRSVRKFLPTSIPEIVQGDILEAGRLSPSGGNEQPWKFCVVTDPSQIAGVAQIAYRQQWIASSPLLIVLCVTPVDDARGGRDIQKHRYPEYAAAIDALDASFYHALNQEEHQTKIAGTHMMLAALEHGVGSCWVSLFEVKRLAAFLHLPEGCLPAEILVFGYPADEQPPIPKKPLDQLLLRPASKTDEASA